jgi:hypothetical protein
MNPKPQRLFDNVPYAAVHPFAERTIMSTELMPLAAAQSYERQAVGRGSHSFTFQLNLSRV